MSKSDYKNRIPFGNTMDPKVHEELLKYKDETGIPMSKIFDKAILQYLESQKKKKK